MSLKTSYVQTPWLERPTGVSEVMGSNPVGNSDLFLSHTRGNISLKISCNNYTRNMNTSPLNVKNLQPQFKYELFHI